MHTGRKWSLYDGTYDIEFVRTLVLYTQEIGTRSKFFIINRKDIFQILLVPLKVVLRRP